MPGEALNVLVTGGASGIGAACAARFAAAGWRVMIADIQDEKGVLLAASLGGDASYVRLDVTREEDFAHAVDAVVARWGALDCLVGNAAIVGVLGPVASLPVAEWDHAQNVILRSVFLGTKHAARVMQPRRSGSIVNIASAAGLVAGWSPHAYAAAKAGVVHFTHSTALELIEDGIRVNCICPGNVATPIHTGVTDERWRARMERIAVAQRDDQPLARFAEPEEIADAALWLAGDGSSFVVGHALVVDGGMLAGRPWRQQPAHLRTFHPALKP